MRSLLRELHGSWLARLMGFVSVVLAINGCVPPESGVEYAGPYPSNAIAPFSYPRGQSDFPDTDAIPSAARLALVIGNNSYTAWTPLKAATNDAAVVGAALTRRKFTLIGGRVHNDVSAERFRELIDTTVQAAKLKPGAVVVVYFAGHGFVDQGHNYLAPVDAPERENAKATSISVIEIATKLRAAGTRLTAMFLDACREYKPGRGGGLSDEAVPDNTFIGFSAQFGTVAPDLGYYAAALSKTLDSRLAYLDDFHLSVSADVIRNSLDRQAPVFKRADRMMTGRTRATASAANVSDAAKRCANAADFRMIFSDPRWATQMPTSGIAFTSGYTINTLLDIERDCLTAFDGGRRDPAILRGLATVWSLEVTIFKRPEYPGGVETSLAFLIQSAESGDTFSNYFLAVSAAKQKSGLPLTVVKDRLLFAANGSDTYVAGYVGLMLWHPMFAQFRRDALFPEEKALGIEIVRRVALTGDPLMLGIVASLKDKEPRLAGVKLGDAFNRALSRQDLSFGMYIRGLSVRDSLMLFAIMDSFRDDDWAQFVRLSKQADGDLDRLISVSRRAGLPFPSDIGAKFRLVAGCFTVTGRNLDGQPIAGLTADRTAGMAFLREAAAAGLPEAQKAITNATSGSTTPCRSL